MEFVYRLRYIFDSVLLYLRLVYNEFEYRCEKKIPSKEEWKTVDI